MEDTRRKLGQALLKTIREDDPEPITTLIRKEGKNLREKDLKAALEALKIQAEKGNVSENTVKTVEETLRKTTRTEKPRPTPDRDPLAQYAGVDRILGVIMQGKEAAVLKAEKEGRELALKVYLRHTGRERTSKEIIHRLEDTQVRRIQRGDAALREYGRLKKAHEAGVRVPQPLDAKPGVIVMEYIPGEPLFKAPELPDPETTLRDLLNQIRKLAVDAELVHGDLSAFNVIVTRDGTPYIIDLSEAVKIKEPGAFETLRKDVENVVSFFRRKYGTGEDIDVDEFVENVKKEVYGR